MAKTYSSRLGSSAQQVRLLKQQILVVLAAARLYGK
jgi:hypothetical protein